MKLICKFYKKQKYPRVSGLETRIKNTTKAFEHLMTYRLNHTYFLYILHEILDSIVDIVGIDVQIWLKPNCLYCVIWVIFESWFVQPLNSFQFANVGTWFPFSCYSYKYTSLLDKLLHKLFTYSFFFLSLDIIIIQDVL